MIFTFVWDFFPIASILVFHRRNFAKAHEVKGDGRPRSVSVDTQQETLENRILQSVMQSFQSFVPTTTEKSHSLNLDTDSNPLSRPFGSMAENYGASKVQALSSNLSGLGRLTGQFEVYQFEMGLFSAMLREEPKKRAVSGDGLMRSSTSLDLLGDQANTEDNEFELQRKITKKTKSAYK